jgi:hypothetical protein
MESSAWRRQTPKEEAPKVELTDTSPFFIIFSNASHVTLVKTLNEFYAKYNEKYGKSNLIEPMILSAIKTKTDGKYHETDRSYAVMDPKIHHFIKTLGRHSRFNTNFLIVKSYDYPREASFDLFVKIHKAITLGDADEYIHSRLELLTSWGYLTENDYEIKFPHTSREMNTHNGCAYITFKKHYSEKKENQLKIVLSRLLLNDTYWPGTDIKVNCYWCKPQADKNIEVSEFTESEVKVDNDVKSHQLPKIHSPKIGPASSEEKPVEKKKHFVIVEKKEEKVVEPVEDPDGFKEVKGKKAVKRAPKIEEMNFPVVSQ